MANKDTALAKPLEPSELIAKIALTGNLAPLSEEQRWEYYRHYCQYLGLDPITKPFDLLTTTERDGTKKTVLYANASCATQIADLRGVQYGKPEMEYEDSLGVLTISVEAKLPSGRSCWRRGVVAIRNLDGKSLENAIKKAETQAHRRATLALCGVAMPDESELEDIAGAQTTKFAGMIGIGKESSTVTIGSRGVMTITPQAIEDRVKQLLREAGSTDNEVTTNYVIEWLKRGAYQTIARQLKCNADDLAREFRHLREENAPLLELEPETQQEIRDELKPAREKLAEAKERNKPAPPSPVPQVYTAENRAHGQFAAQRLDKVIARLTDGCNIPSSDILDAVNEVVKREDTEIVESRYELTDKEVKAVCESLEAWADREERKLKQKAKA